MCNHESRPFGNSMFPPAESNYNSDFISKQFVSLINIWYLLMIFILIYLFAYLPQLNIKRGIYAVNLLIILSMLTLLYEQLSLIDWPFLAVIWLARSSTSLYTIFDMRVPKVPPKSRKYPPWFFKHIISDLRKASIT